MKKLFEFIFGKPVPSQVKELRKIPKTEWAKLWCKLNSWKIPDGITKPGWWDNAFPSERRQNMRMDFLRPLMKEIVDTIGEKACNREWNIDRMTDEEHEQFWKDRGKQFEVK